MADGTELPSRLAIQSMAAVLEIDPARLAALAAADYAERRYGVISSIASEQLELVDVRLLWGRLSEAQRAILLATMRDFVEGAGSPEVKPPCELLQNRPVGPQWQ